MIRVYTDNAAYFERIFSLPILLQPFTSSERSIEIQMFIQKFFNQKEIVSGLIAVESVFNHLFVKENVTFSQFDFLSKITNKEENLQDGIICFAGGGDKFHGFRQRKWHSLNGNIHISLLLKPQRAIKNADAAFLILAANAVNQTINQLQRLDQPAKIKWVNDILIENEKVGGVLARTQIQGERIERVIIGIGINVNEKPPINNNAFVAGATTINAHIRGEKYTLSEIFFPLIAKIDQNYQLILQNKYDTMLQYYIENSIVIGKYVEIYSDPPDGDSELIAKGRVLSISEILELQLSESAKPVRKGRIKLQYDES